MDIARFFIPIIAGGGFKLPYSLDFSLGSMGKLIGTKAAIVGGVLTNTPGESANIITTDPGLEATYTAGLCATLAKTGTPTVAESADAHGGSKAQEFTGAALNNTLAYAAHAGVAGGWYKMSMWGKRTAGAGGTAQVQVYQGSSLPVATNVVAILSAAYAKETVGFISTSTNNIIPYAVREGNTTGFDTVIVDDGELVRLTYADLFSMISNPLPNRLATVKVQPDTLVDCSLSGIVAWANANASPDTYLLCYWRYRTPKDRISFGLMKCVAGTWTSLIAETSAVTVANAWLEIRPVDADTVGMYYNNVQISTDKDVADVPGAYAGMVISGGNNVKSFFVG